MPVLPKIASQKEIKPKSKIKSESSTPKSNNENDKEKRFKLNKTHWKHNFKFVIVLCIKNV